MSHEHAVSPSSSKSHLRQLILKRNTELRKKKEEKESQSEETQHFTKRISTWAGAGPLYISNLKNLWAQKSTTPNSSVYFHAFVQNFKSWKVEINIYVCIFGARVKFCF